MLLYFDEMELTVLEHFQGGEKSLKAQMYLDGQNKIMRSFLEPGASVGLHTHEAGSEIIYILEGTGKAVTDGVEERLVPGVCHYCPKGSAHTVINDSDGDLRFFAVVCKQ